MNDFKQQANELIESIKKTTRTIDSISAKLGYPRVQATSPGPIFVLTNDGGEVEWSKGRPQLTKDYIMEDEVLSPEEELEDEELEEDVEDEFNNEE